MKTSTDLLQLLAGHIGRGNGAGVAQLAAALGMSERDVRKLVVALRQNGVAVCGTPKTGYYIAATADELAETIEFLKHRALHSLVLASRMSKVPLPDLLGQLHVPT